MNQNVKCEIMLGGHAPSRAHVGDAGWDLYVPSLEARAEIPMQIRVGEIMPIPLRIKIAIPKGYYGRIADRSGLAIRGIHILGGVVDSGYRGELKVIVGNFGTSNFEVKANTRIAQLIIIKIADNDMEVVQFIQDAEAPDQRGTGGFGSTGMH